MLRPLRQRHRVIVFALTVVLPTAFAVGIASRREAPISRSGVPGFSMEVGNQAEVWSRADLWEGKTINTRLLKTEHGSGLLAVGLEPKDRIIRPDVLVYWVPGERKIHDSLPGDAFLLGSFEQASLNPLTLPEKTSAQTGMLVLYSLADQEVIATSKPFSTR
jgi:hypothetical protein